MQNCVIVSGGIINDYSFYKSFFSSDDYVICADGGIKHIAQIGIVPDLWLGDFDSCRFSDIIKKHPEFKGAETITLCPQKDETDTHYACIEAIKRGYKSITIIGGFGGRIDHMLSNIHLLEFLEKNNVSGQIIDEKNTVRICSDKIVVNKKRKYLSLIPLDDSVCILRTCGLKYPLNDYLLNREISMGVSNEITDSTAEIYVKSGKILVVESDD